MADMTDTLKSLLGDNADEKISEIMKILNPENEKGVLPTESAKPNPDADSPDITPEMILAAKSLMSKLSVGGDDDRTRLLKSLKPYMSHSRQSGIDTAVKLLNLAHISQFFKGVI